MNHLPKKRLPLAILAALGLLGGCTMTPQDTGTGGEAQVTGKAVDGYLAGAVVFVDTNGNNALDAWEPSAITDGDGFYTFNPNDNTDYCNLPTGDSKRVHCLAAPAALGEVLIRVTGGYDRITGEPFEGTLTVKADLAQVGDGAADVVVNPLTSLLDAMDATAAATWLANEGLTEDDVRGDILASLAVAADRSDENDPVNASDLPAVKLAWQIHKLVDVLAARIQAAHPNQFGGTDQPTDASHFVYEALAQVYTENPSEDSDTLLTNATRLERVIDLAEQAIQAAGLTGGLSAQEKQDLAAWGVQLAGLARDLFASGVSNKGDVEARARALEAVAALMRDSAISLASTLPGSIQNALTLAGDATYLTNLRSNKVDMRDLVGKFKAGPVAAADTDYSARPSLTANLGISGDSVAGQTLSMNGSSSADSAALTFNEDGTLNAEIQFDDPDLQIANDQPIGGTWEQVDDYTMVLNLEVAEGVTMPVVVKTTVDGNYSFDLGGEQVTWIPQ